MRIIIVDYGAGNLESVRKAIWDAGFEGQISKRPEAVLAADRLILPGVGAAGRALQSLRHAGLDSALHEAVRMRGRPLLGICLGMQLLAEENLEFGRHPGLGWIKGRVVPLRGLVNGGTRVPHMGWNGIVPAPTAEQFFMNTRGKREFYFCHSYALVETVEDVVAATVDYGRTLAAAILSESVFATQFHPEKSQVNGVRLLQAFFQWRP